MSSIGEKGAAWDACGEPQDLAQTLREAMHDRDKFEREAAYWREQTEAMRESCGYAHLAPCWEAP